MFMTLFHESSCDVFMRICLCFHVLFLCFYRENRGVGVDGLSLRFILYSSSFDMDCEVNFVCCFADSPISGSFNPVLLRRCFVVGPRHTWMYPLRFILLQDEY